jgi:hypothetical protein
VAASAVLLLVLSCLRIHAYMCWQPKGEVYVEFHARDIKQRLEYEWRFSMPPSQDACTVLSYVSALREKQQTIEVAVPLQVTVTGWQSSPTFRLV